MGWDGMGWDVVRFCIYKSYKNIVYPYIYMWWRILSVMWFITNIVSVSSIKHKAANKLLSSGLMADMGGLVVGSGGGFGGIKSLSSSSSSSSSEKIVPRTEGQRLYLNALQNKNTSILIGLGPAGTGKTMFSCQTAIDGILAGTYQKIVLTRPVVSVEEDIGFLPGSLVQKMDPWTRPLFDIFLERFSKAKLNSMIQNGVIEISPLGYMRGRTFKNTFVIADEMQNSSPMQMKMITTRIGEGSKMVITGDLNQSDRCEKNGLVDLVERLRRVSMKKAMASGDFGLSATLNAIQDKLPDVGAAARRAADNRQQARSAFGQSISGDETTIRLAKDARDAIADPVRNAALKNAAGIPAAALIGPIDKLMAAPQMQGETVQAALAKVRGNIDRISNNGVVNPTALYEIRKDINLLMEGRLAGDDANLKFARQPLMAIKNLIDNRINQASPSPGAWKNYLSTFASQSKSIGQMETVQDVLRRAGTGTVDTAGNPVITPAQLNRILKNEGSDLAKQLTAQQMDGLRKLAADLSAEQLAASASRSSTMNSVTNKLTETNKAIDAGLGLVPGGGAIQNILSGVQSGNKGKVMGLLGDSVLNPNLAAYLMQQGAPAAPANAVPQLSKALAAQLMLRGAPLAVPNVYRPNAAMQLETQR